MLLNLASGVLIEAFAHLLTQGVHSDLMSQALLPLDDLGGVASAIVKRGAGPDSLPLELLLCHHQVGSGHGAFAPIAVIISSFIEDRGLLHLVLLKRMDSEQIVPHAAAVVSCLESPAVELVNVLSADLLFDALLPREVVR